MSKDRPTLTATVRDEGIFRRIILERKPNGLYEEIPLVRPIARATETKPIPTESISK